MQQLICLLRPLMLDAATFQLLSCCTMIHLSLLSLTRREFCALKAARSGPLSRNGGGRSTSYPEEPFSSDTGDSDFVCTDV
jgi:hypothetical protein